MGAKISSFRLSSRTFSLIIQISPKNISLSVLYCLLQVLLHGFVLSSVVWLTLLHANTEVKPLLTMFTLVLTILLVA
jgi:hypothetical protein